VGRKGSNGAALRALAEGVSDPRQVALLHEAARITDRLDELDRIIAGKGVLKLMRFRLKDLFSPEEERRVSVEVRFDSVLAEARQQATALRGILTALGVEKVDGAAKPGRSASLGDQIAQARARRQAAAQGSA